MKIRKGFVSNSSSSSFIVGWPMGLSKKEKKQIILKKMGAKEDSLFYDAALGIAECILESDKITTQSMAEEYGYDSWEELLKEDGGHEIEGVKVLLKKDDFQMYRGCAYNDSSNPAEILFCEMGWEVDDDNFFISKEKGFKMKIRTGFVSNSSTSSFLMYGCMMDAGDISHLLKKSGFVEEDVEDIFEWAWDNADKLKEAGVKMEDAYQGEYICIGRSWDSIGDDQTGLQFKTEVETCLKKILGPDVEIGTQEAAWRDG